MERQDIEVFLTLGEELHFARTAERLRLAPASISQTIKKLERRFGAPLFTRTTRRVGLTPLGRQLLDDLGPAYRQVEAAIERAITAGRGETGELRLGYMSAAVARRMLALIDTVRGHAPGIRVDIRETALSDLYGPLRRAEVDLSVLPLPVTEPDLTVGPVLLSETALLAVSASHPLARRAPVTADHLTEQTFLFAQGLPGYWVEHHLPLARSAVSVTTLPGFQEMLAYAASGHGVAVVGAQVEQFYPRPNLACLPMEGGSTFDYALVWRTDDLSPPAAAFLRHVVSSGRPPTL
ncbi:LysR family transcriptional regulator [Amycolatopsis sp. YIM 10]|uniref:LysR family transcriptional regulator n=1 Tax=Amycolatopsis sp. YIM 10 TaxID=2653857 RepID=UPI0012900F70|nr:LysR family transcriptional regulator [Amycolatopsis sp. YIM 10]QFU91051.1 HTH-type transcriptional regulator GltC [Amycolatopsis sp. YIM 10]